MQTDNFKKLYEKYAKQPLFIKLVINFFALFFIHSSFEIFLKISLFNYTSAYNAYYPSSTEFDVSIFYPYFYETFFKSLIITVLALIFGTLLAFRSKLRRRRNEKKIGSVYWKPLYRLFLKKIFKETVTDNRIFKIRNMFLVIHFLLIFQLLMFVIEKIGYSNSIIAFSGILLIVVGYFFGNNFNQYFMVINVVAVIITSILISSSPMKIQNYLMRTGTGGDIKIVIESKSTKAFKGYLILLTKSKTVVLNEDRKSLITLKNSEILRTTVDKVNMRFIDVLPFYSDPSVAWEHEPVNNLGSINRLWRIFSND